MAKRITPPERRVLGTQIGIEHVAHAYQTVKLGIEHLTEALPEGETTSPALQDAIAIAASLADFWHKHMKGAGIGTV
jgi:hypothetical protein